MNISEHITLAEATKSQTAIRYGIDNTPTPEDIIRMKAVAENCFEPLRRWYGKPIGISSFYRCKKLNTKVRGSKTSQHLIGAAIDIDGDIFGGITNKEIFEWLRDNVTFDELIWEYGDANNPAWVHVSYIEGHNDGDILTIP